MRSREVKVSAAITYFTQCYLAVFFVYPLALAKYGMDMQTIGWLMGIFPLSNMISRPMGSFFTEKLGVKRTLLYFGSALTLLSVVMLFTHHFVPLMSLRFAQGYVYGIFMVALTAYQAQVIPSRVRGAVYAFISLWYVLPQATIVPLADYFVSREMLGAYFALIPVVALMFVLSSLPVKQNISSANKKNKLGEQWGTWGEVFAVKGIKLLVLSTLLFATANATGLQFMASLASSKGLSPSVFFVAVTTMTLISRIFGKKLMDTCPKRMHVMGIAVSLISVGAVLAMLAKSNYFLFLAGGVYGVGMGYSFPVALALVPDLTPLRLCPKGVALGFFGYDMGWVIAPLLVGYLSGILGLAATMIPIMVACGALELILWFFCWRKLAAGR